LNFLLYEKNTLVVSEFSQQNTTENGNEICKITLKSILIIFKNIKITIWIILTSICSKRFTFSWNISKFCIKITSKIILNERKEMLEMLFKIDHSKFYCFVFPRKLKKKTSIRNNVDLEPDCTALWWHKLSLLFTIYFSSLWNNLSWRWLYINSR